jgi:plasmid maintenance system antidote protein VapI
MNPPPIFYVQIGIDVVMCILILYFLWRVGRKPVAANPEGERARQELQQLIRESQQSAQHFLDSLGEMRRSLKELAYALDEKEARLQALCGRVEAITADAAPERGLRTSASGDIDREQVLQLKKDGASLADIVRQTGLTEGEVNLIIDLARSQHESQ